MTLPRDFRVLLLAFFGALASDAPALRAAGTAIAYPAKPGPDADNDLVFHAGDEEYRGSTLSGFGLELPAQANAGYVDPNEPAPYAFEGYRRALPRDDYALGKTHGCRNPAQVSPRKK